MFKDVKVHYNEHLLQPEDYTIVNGEVVLTAQGHTTIKSINKKNYYKNGRQTTDTNEDKQLS